MKSSLLFRRKSRTQSAPASSLPPTLPSHSVSGSGGTVTATVTRDRPIGGSCHVLPTTAPPSPLPPTHPLVRKAGMARSVSLPGSLQGCHIRGIMKFCTVDDSLHSKYGESKEGSERSSSPRTNHGGGGVHSPPAHIQFKDLLIREYNRTVGDNPSCSSGPPISIAWDYDPETKVISIDQYESLRPPRRSHFEMILPREVRHQMLRREWDVSQAQIASAVRNNIRAKNQRRATVNNLGKAQKMEEFFETAGSKLKRGILFQKSTTQQAHELDAMFQKASRLREQAKVDAFTADMDDVDDGCGGGGGDGSASFNAQKASRLREQAEMESLTTADDPSESYSPHDRHVYTGGGGGGGAHPHLSIVATEEDGSDSTVGLDLDDAFHNGPNHAMHQAGSSGSGSGSSSDVVLPSRVASAMDSLKRTTAAGLHLQDLSNSSSGCEVSV